MVVRTGGSCLEASGKAGRRGQRTIRTLPLSRLPESGTAGRPRRAWRWLTGLWFKSVELSWFALPNLRYCASRGRGPVVVRHANALRR